MKKFAIFFLFFLAFQANAQVTVKPGVRAGVNISNLTNTGFDSKADFYAGGFVAIKLSGFYTLQPEITYSRQGAKGKEYNIDFDPIVGPSQLQDKDYSLQYVSLGVMNKFDIIQGFHAVVGPTLDIKVSDNFDGSYEDDLIGFDLAVNAGLGYTLPIGLTIEVRYKLGLVDIFGDNYNYNYDYYDDDYYNNGSYDDVILNSMVQLGLAYTF